MRRPTRVGVLILTKKWEDNASELLTEQSSVNYGIAPDGLQIRHRLPPGVRVMGHVWIGDYVRVRGLGHAIDMIETARLGTEPFPIAGPAGRELLSIITISRARKSTRGNELRVCSSREVRSSTEAM